MRKTNDYLYQGCTRSTCPECRRVIDAQVRVKQNRVYLHKYCPEHGHSSALVSSDAAWTAWAEKFNKPGERPLELSSAAKDGCPSDCGLCEDHQQHSCFTQIEITDVCDLSCPSCYMGPQNRWYLSVDRAEWMFKRMVELEGTPETVTLTGGEPTLHPEIFEIAARAHAQNIRHVLINTNGNKIARDPDFAKRMADLGVYCYLQFDGFDDDAYRTLRGQPLLDLKLRALENLEKAKCPTVLAATIAKGVNEQEAGKIVRFVVDHEFAVCASFQPMTFVNRLDRRGGVDAWAPGESACPDPLDRITQPEMLDLIEQQTDGLVQRKDFIPVPCHNAACGSVTYLLIGDDREVVPVTRMFKIDPYLDYVKNRSRVDMDDLFQMTRVELEKLWSMSAVGGSAKVQQGIKNLVTRCCGTDAAGQLGDFEKRVKQISVHMFMDAHTWDMSRARKCCIHFMLPDGKLVPFCQYNLFHRGKSGHLYEQFARVPSALQPEVGPAR